MRLSEPQLRFLDAITRGLYMADNGIRGISFGFSGGSSDKRVYRWDTYWSLQKKGLIYSEKSTGLDYWRHHLYLTDAGKSVHAESMKDVPL